MEKSKETTQLYKYVQSFIDEELNEREVTILKKHFQSDRATYNYYQQLQKVNQHLYQTLRSLPDVPNLRQRLEERVKGKQPGQSSESEENNNLRIGGYEIIEKIGEGSMGAVYKAIQVSLKRVVALKILSDRYADNDSYVRRFNREAQAAAALQHPNIVQVFDVGQEGKRNYFSMEYVEGETVGKILQREGLMSLNKALEVVIQITRALDHAEKNQIVHRDIKPDNIIIDKNGTARLADLGMAKRSIEIEEENRKSNSLTRAGTIMGTPDYMSPEQASNSKEVTTQADIYSLGATFYHMITGRTAFKGSTILEVLSNVLHEPVRFHPEEDKHIPLSVQRVIRKSMAKNLEERYLSAEEFLRALLDLRNKFSTGTGVMQLDSTYLPQLRLDSAIVKSKKVSTIFGEKRRRPSFPQHYYIIGGVVTTVMVVLTLIMVFTGGGEGEVKYNLARQELEAHPEKFKDHLANFRSIYNEHPDSEWGKKAQAEYDRLVQHLEGKREEILFKVASLLAKNRYYEASRLCRQFEDKYGGMTVADKMAQLRQSVESEAQNILRRKRLLLNQSQSRQSIDLLLEEVKHLVDPATYREIARNHQSRRW